MLNYSGHGGEDGWTSERVLDASDLPKWRNTDKMPLFVTATCSFARYDNPDKYSIGEKLMLYPNGGAIALGHPLGCTGSKLTVQLLNEMRRRNQRYGIVTACVGGGQGIAGIFERLN